jgi:excisionase family DNA binding protein
MVGVQEAARLVGRSPETVRRWVWSGRIQATKQGNKLLLRRSDLPVTGPDAAAPPSLGLLEWAEAALSRSSATPGASAADLIFEDRAERADR